MESRAPNIKWATLVGHSSCKTLLRDALVGNSSTPVKLLCDMLVSFGAVQYEGLIDVKFHTVVLQELLKEDTNFKNQHQNALFGQF